MKWFLNKHKDIQSSDFIETSKLYTEYVLFINNYNYSVKRNSIVVVDHKADGIIESEVRSGSNIDSVINQITSNHKSYYTDIFMKRWEEYFSEKEITNVQYPMEVDDN